MLKEKRKMTKIFGKLLVICASRQYLCSKLSQNVFTQCINFVPIKKKKHHHLL